MVIVFDIAAIFDVKKRKDNLEIFGNSWTTLLMICKLKGKEVFIIVGKLLSSHKINSL